MRRALLLLLLAGCAGPTAQPAGPAPAEPPPPETGGERLEPAHPTGGPPTAPGPDAAPPSANDFDACVKECVRSRQMQAVSMEKIEADCQGECAAK